MVRVGITDYAQKALGDLVYVELPRIGDIIKRSEVVGVVESVKGASDVYAPVSGTVRGINDKAVAKPSLINKSPEADGTQAGRDQYLNYYHILGWLCEIELSDANEYDTLHDEMGYRKHCKGQTDEKE